MENSPFSPGSPGRLIKSTAESVNIAPIISSSSAGWQSVLVEKYAMPANISTGPQITYASNAVIVQCTGRVSVTHHSNNGQQRATFLPGDIGIFPVGLPFSARVEEDNQFIVLHLNDQILNQAAGNLTAKTQFALAPQLSIQDPVIRQLTQLLMLELETGDRTSRLYAESLTNSLAIHLLRRYSLDQQPLREFRGGLSRLRLREIIDYIEANLANEIMLGDLAALAQLSVYHFNRAFKQSMGLTPIQYLINCRIERAKDLLRATDLPLVTIAYQLGFSNQSHFNRLFSKLTGVAPGSYRKKR